jgi:outer membrane receptor for ferrienterochelin and colicins
MYEKEGKLKIGLEASYFSLQKLSDGAIGKAYWLSGLMAEKLWKNFSIFVNLKTSLTRDKQNSIPFIPAILITQHSETFMPRWTDL